MTDTQNSHVATFGGGCFWCTEAIFQQFQGVSKVVSGYAGGEVPNPTYEQVCSGSTGHAEVIQVTYDSEVISFTELLDVFFQTHDPTTLNRQGHDVGTQYRSVVFYHDEQQQQQAEQFIARLNESDDFQDPIVTEVSPFTEFFAAENYHQNYNNLNGNQPYCAAVIRPKLEKSRQLFSEKLKTDS